VFTSRSFARNRDRARERETERQRARASDRASERCLRVDAESAYVSVSVRVYVIDRPGARVCV